MARVGRGFLGIVVGLLGAAVLAGACDGGALQSGVVNGGRGGTDGTGTGGSQGGGGMAGSPAPTSCGQIATAPGAFNPCGRTYSLAFSPDGALLAAGTEAKRPNVHLWRVSDGAFIRDLDGVGETTYGVAFSPDGTLLATAGGYAQDGALDGLPEIVKIWNVADGSVAARIPATCGSYASTAVFSHDGTLLLTAGERGPAEIWRVSDGALVTSIPYGTTVHNARFAPSDRAVLLGGVDNRATLWSLPTGSLMMTFAGTADEMADASFSPDGGEIATTGINNNVELWDTTTGALHQTMAGHAAYVSHVVWIGRDRLVSNDWGGQVISWTRAGSGDFALSGTWATGGQSLGIAVSPDQASLVAGGADAAGVQGFVFLAL
jgi:WD40 repeat protein